MGCAEKGGSNGRMTDSGRTGRLEDSLAQSGEAKLVVALASGMWRRRVVPLVGESPGSERGGPDLG